MVLLIGSHTAGRKWIKHEIETAWQRGLGLAGLYIHGLKDQSQHTASRGADPFATYAVNAGSTPLSNYVAMYDPTTADTLLVRRQG